MGEVPIAQKEREPALHLNIDTQRNDRHSKSCVIMAGEHAARYGTE